MRSSTVDLFRDSMVDEKHHFIADGHHRVHAARAAGLETINAIVHPGGLDEAIEFSSAGEPDPRALPQQRRQGAERCR